MTSSGTYSFSPSNADVLLESFDRCEIRPAAITSEHMISAKRSLNLELQAWSNLGVNLWCVDLLTIPLMQGVTTYTLPQETVSLLDVYLRQFSLSGTFNVTPNLSIVNGSAIVTVRISNHGLSIGNYINFATPVAIGNLLIQGYYPVTVTDTNDFTIISSVTATSTVNNGGVVPLFTASAGQVAVQVTLPNHGMAAGETFNVFASTNVGGLTLLGPYTVTGVTDSSNFGIAVPQQVLFTDTQYENTALAQIQFQQGGQAYTDNVMTPFGRTDYANLPNKLSQGRPTTYWFNRQITPEIAIWQTADQNGPYQICAYRMRRVQDASPTMGQTPDIPYRFFDAFCARLACRLAVKYAKPLLPVLEKYSTQAWSEAQIEDVERADIMILPDLSSYYGD